MSDWLEEIRAETNAAKLRLAEMESARKSAFNGLDGRVIAVLQEAVDFLNETHGVRNRVYRINKLNQGNRSEWIIGEVGYDGDRTIFRLSVYVDAENNDSLMLLAGDRPQLYVRTQVSEYSDEWLKAQLLPAVRENVPRPR